MCHKNTTEISAEMHPYEFLQKIDVKLWFANILIPIFKHKYENIAFNQVCACIPVLF